MEERNENSIELVKVTRCKALQVERNISLKELCERTGLAKSTLLHFQAKNKNLRQKNISLLCKALSVPEDTDLWEIVEVPRSVLSKSAHTFD